MNKRQFFLATALLGLTAITCQAATITDPIPYVRVENTPDGFFDHPGIYCIQDFEDPNGPWQIDFTIDNGNRIGPKHISGDGVPVTDSVDLDDGEEDGDGTMGSSWLAPKPALSITFTSPTPAASFVLTDGDILATKVTISAFDANDNLLMSREYDADFLDDVYTGTTAEDRFFGITAGAGELVKRISLAIEGGTGIEIDHIQFLKPIPEPTSMALVLVGLLGLCGCRRRRR